jgi:chromate transporter
MEWADLSGLFWHFMLLSAMAVGGSTVVMPDMYRYVVEEHAWMTGREFADLYALAQASPGPNALWVTLVGLQVGGWQGAAATTLALLLPATAFSLVMVALHTRNPDALLAVAVRRGLAPIAVGFVLSSSWVLLRSVNHDWHGYLLTAIAFVLVMRTRLNPLWLLGGGALAGIAGFV